MTLLYVWHQLAFFAKLFSLIYQFLFIKLFISGCSLTYSYMWCKSDLNFCFTPDLGEGNPWLNVAHDRTYDPTEDMYIELHATAMLCLPSGECMLPDATSCTTLTSALYSSVSEDDVLKRQLRVCLHFYFLVPWGICLYNNALPSDSFCNATWDFL